MKLRRNNPDKLTMDMTPMIDVVFLLLIFFMVSTTFDKQSQIDVSLPDSESATFNKDEQASEIAIDAAGHIVIEDRLLADDSVQALRIALLPLAQRAKKPSLLLKADKATPHGVVVRVMDVAASLGLTQIVIATQQPVASPAANP